ncbi:MAG: DUF3386 family protein [Cyanobacteria bacterium P01_E01_bin.45]
MLNPMGTLFSLATGTSSGCQPSGEPIRSNTRRIASWLCVCLIALVVWGLSPNYCHAASDFTADEPSASSLRARELYESAFSNRYVDGPDFPGYEAEVSVTYNRQIYQGRVRVSPDYRIDIYNMVREDARNYALEQLNQAHAQHQPAPFATRHGDSDFTLVRNEPSGASEIEERGPNINASYRIQNGRIVEVTRHIGDFDVTVTTQATIQPAAGYLPTEYREVVRDRTTNDVISAREYRDYYMKVSKYFLLHRRLMREADSLELLQGKPIDETAIIITGIDAIPAAGS